MNVTIAGYQLADRIGPATRRSVVFTARHGVTGRRAVVKLPAMERPLPGHLAQIRTEFETLQRFDHPDIVRPVALEPHGPGVALVMEEAPGLQLGHWVDRDLPSVADGLAVAVDLATAVAAIHAAGVVHRDLNPSNVMVDPDTLKVTVVDFGIASVLAREAQEALPATALQGTLPYLSPEQTGRMNRSVDHRTDLYSVGATLMYVFSGQPPFRSKEPAELVHHHLARVPDTLRSRRSEVPAILSELVARLLRKSAEDRYQSASGLAADLQRIRDGLASGEVPSFELGADDHPLRFAVPEALYGRSEEIAAVLNAFGGEASRPRLLLVAGAPGIGKSRLVQEIQRPLARRAGYFASGKFDQFTRDVPFDSLATALQGLVRQVLTEPDERLSARRAEILEALGPNAGLLVELVPDLERLIGEQPAVPELPPSESRNRFTQLLRRFVEVFARPNHPLVLFLDDLQWVDGATLAWLESVLFAPELASLFVIGAYRDNEVDERHPLAIALDRAADRGAQVTAVEVGPLSPDDVRRLVADALLTERDDPDAGRLAWLVSERTGGNPFFVGQVLEALDRDGAIRFSPARGRWTVDLERAERLAVTDNVVDLLVGRIHTLSRQTSSLLQTASCIGSRFAVDTLALLAEGDETTVSEALEEALQAGLLVPHAHWEDTGRVELRFQHDRVQQAAHAMIEPGESQRIHHRLGRMLLDASPDPAADEDLFVILRHLVAAGPLVTEDRLLGELHLAAATRARRSTAYEPAHRHLLAALERLRRADAGLLEQPGPLGFELTLELARCAHQLGRDEEAETAYGRAIELAPDPASRGRALEQRVHFYTDRERFLEAFETGTAAAIELGIPLVQRFVPPLFIADLLRTRVALIGTSVEDLRALPAMTDPSLLLGARLAAVSLKSAYQVRPELAVANANRLVRVCLQHGTFPESGLAYLVMGPIFQGGVMGQHQTGYDWAQLALEMVDRFDHRALAAEVTFVSAYFANSWRRPMTDSERLYRDAFDKGVEVGDLFHASCAAAGLTQSMFMRGAPLAQVEAECDRLVPWLEGSGNVEGLGVVLSVRQAVRNLAGRTAGRTDWSDEGFDEVAFVASLEGYGARHFAHVYWVDKLRTLLLWGEVEAAIEVAATSAGFLSASVGLQHAAEHTFLVGLLAADRIRRGDGGGQRAVLRKSLKSLRAWADGAPETFGHKAALLEAESARVAGRNDAACAAYERSIAEASGAGHLHNLALARQRAGEHLLDLERAEGARLQLREAAYDYERWGSVPLSLSLERGAGEWSGGGFLDVAFTTARTATLDTTGSSPDLQLDLGALMRAAGAIAGEVHLEGLLERMLALLIENAGATRGVLVLPTTTGGARVEAHGDAEGVRLLPGTALEDFRELPQAVVLYVLRTQEALVLADATADERFSDDPWVAAETVRSVLCVPFLDKRSLRGLVYLENPLTAGAFSADRVELISLLTGQIAISIDKAMLYDRLEDKVRERTEQLQRRNEFIRQVFGRYLSDDIVDSLLETPKGLKLGGERREVTILMTDLRGFTPLTESLQPEQVVGVINNYLSRMTEVILAYNGTIDEFIGDAILVIFGAPFQREDDADRAVACALAMQQALVEVNQANRAQGLPEVEMGVGIATGEVVVGNIGSERRAKYGVVGRSVNLAARVESLTVGGQVLVADSTVRAMDATIEHASTITVQPKGINEPVEVFDVVGIGAPFELHLDRHDDVLEPLEVPLSLELNALVGKMGDDVWVQAALTSRSATSGILQTDLDLEALSNVRLRLPGIDEVAYAKVLPGDEPRPRIRFTSVPDPMKATLLGLQDG